MESGPLTQMWSPMQKSQMWNNVYMRTQITWNLDSPADDTYNQLQNYSGNVEQSWLKLWTHSFRVWWGFKSKSIFVRRKVCTKAERQKLSESSLTWTVNDKRSLHSAHTDVCPRLWGSNLIDEQIVQYLHFFKSLFALSQWAAQSWIQ